jgi:hypothetical protein
MRISFACTDDDWSKSARAGWERLPTLQRVLHFERLVFTCIPLLVGIASGEPTGILLAAIAALVVFLAFPYWIKRVLDRRMLRQLKDAHGTSDWGTIEYSISERGMTYRDIAGDASILWWACKGVSLHRGDVYVDTIRLAHRIPRRAFASETEVRSFMAFVDDHKGFAGGAAAAAPDAVGINTGAGLKP